MYPFLNYHYFLAWTIAAISCGCVSSSTQHQRASDTVALTGLLSNHYQNSPRIEIERFSRDIVDTSYGLRGKWGVGFAPLIHNSLVNGGFREHGLCFHWANELFREVQDTIPRGLVLSLIQTDGGRINDHHALSVHHALQNWKEGILLDAWKGGGRVHFCPISDSSRLWCFEADRPYAGEPE